MGLGEFLQIIHGVHERIVIPLGHTGFEQMEQDVCVLRIILVPGL